MVLDAVAARDAVVPMRFPAVVEERAVVDELLAPNEEHFVTLLENLEGRSQFTLTGRYEQDAVLREVLEGDEEIRALREKVRELPEDASYYDRVRLGELIVGALEQRREVEGAASSTGSSRSRWQPWPTNSVHRRTWSMPRSSSASGRRSSRTRWRGSARNWPARRLRSGPVAPYDFTPED